MTTEANTAYMNGFNDYLDGQHYDAPLSQHDADEYQNGWVDAEAYLNSKAEQFEYEMNGYGL